jgi:hypothetical protein
MTIRERMTAVLQGKLPDRIPFAMYNNMFRYGTCERTERNNGLGIIARGTGVSMINPPFFVRPDCLSAAKNTDFSIRYKWNGKQLVEVHEFNTPVGLISQHTVKDSFGGNHRIKYYVESKEDYKILQYCIENSMMQVHEEIIEEQLRTLGDDGVLFYRLDRSPYQKLLIELAGAEKFLVDLFLEKKLLQELMETIEQRLLEQFEYALQSKAKLLWLPDNVTCDLTPPDAFKAYCLPYYNKLGQECKKNNKTLIVHLDGKLRGLKDQISQAQFDVVDSFSLPEVSGDLPIQEAIENWPDKVINPSFPAPLSRKSPSEIHQYLENLSDAIGSNTPYMIQISEDIPIETYDTVLPAVNQFINNRQG